MNELLLWNKTEYADTLAFAFGNENIITNNQDFIAISGHLGKFSSLVVLCELEWSSKNVSSNRQEFQGIELVKELRRTYNLDIPVLFVSFQSLSNIFNTEREILTAIGHDFYQLPAAPRDFKTFITKSFGEKGSIQRLSVMELNDIKSFYCSKEGILSHELHYLNHFLDYNITSENHDNIYEELQGSIRKIHELFLADSTNALISFQVAFSALTKENITEAVNHIKRLGENLQKTYGEQANGMATQGKPIEKFRWKILFLDDQINEQHELVKLMKVNGMDVICVDNAPQATNILLKDWSKENSIMVVIADYRLYVKAEGIKRHQKIQGYRFLRDIASTDHLVRLVAFSGLQRKFLLNSFKHYNIRTEVKSKTDYLSSEQTRQLFCDEIIELAEENWEVIEAMPSKCAGFERSLKDAYKEFRMHPAYHKMEGNVSVTAKEYVWEIQKQISDGEEIRIRAIENIKSPLAKTKKDQDAFFNRFQNYLVARRIALWLYAANKKGLASNIDSRKIAEILTDHKYPTDAYRQIISTNLGLSLDDFPKNITIEERRWLHYEMRLNIFHDIILINPVFDKISKIYKDFIGSDETFRDDIKKSKDTSSYHYKQVKYHIDFEKNFTPKIKTPTDIRVLFLIVAKHSRNDIENLQLIKPLVSKLRLSLFENRDKVIYLKSLFQYFNGVYSILNKEQSILTTAPTKIKDKSEFSDKSDPALNKCFERVHELLLSKHTPEENDVADVWKIFCRGEEIIEKKGRFILGTKAVFFAELTKAINDESKLLGNSFDESFGSNYVYSEDSESNDFTDFLDDTELT